MSAAAAATKPQTYFRITQIRSAIGLPARTTGVLQSLGLHKRMATVFHPVEPAVAGKIFKVKELVAVSEVPAAAVMSKLEMRQARRPDPGFWVEWRS